MSTTGHESESINVSGLKSSLQKLKTDYINNTVWTNPQSLTTTQKDQALSNLINKDDINGMARVELKATDNFKTVVEAQTGGNTIFVIKYNFTLIDNVTIPANCVLEFDGGSIIGAANCTLTMNDCYLKGLPKFNNVIFSGNIKNDYFDATWIVNGNDIGAKLNYAQQYFKKLYTPRNTYNLYTPVLLSDMGDVMLYGSYIYCGSVVNDGSAIEIQRCGSIKIFIESLTMDRNDRLDYRDERTINFIGIKFTSCNNCNFTVNSVTYFNENIRCQDIFSTGCSYNQINCLLNMNGNIGIRFYQYDYDGISWSNETVIHGGRFTRLGYISSPVPYGNTYGVFIGGPKADNPSFAIEGREDSNDESSHITIEDASFEHLDYIAYARGMNKYLSIIRNREESVNKGLLKAAKHVYLNYVVGYDSLFNKIDATEATSVYANYPNNVTVDTYQRSYPETPINCVYANNNSIHLKYAESSYLLQRGVIIDTSSNKTFTISYTTDGEYASARGIITKMLDENDNILPMDANTNAPLNNFGDYQAAFNGFVGYTTIVIPNNVKKIFIGVIGTDGVHIKSITVSSGGAIKYTLDNITPGLSADRPAKMEKGIGYYATDLQQYIYYDSVNNKWLDSLGNIISAHKYNVTVDTYVRTYPETPKNCVYAFNNSIRNKYADTDYLLQRGVIIDTSTLKKLYISYTTDGEYASYGGTIIKMLNDTADGLLQMDANTNTPVNEGYSYNSAFNGFKYLSYLEVPNNINYVFIGAVATDGRHIKSITVSADSPMTYILDNINLVGTTADKPAKLEKGLGYYDTDLNKLMYYNSTLNKWLDTLGNEITTIYQPKVTGTNGNFAGFDSNGGLKDSGSKPSDFAPAQS